ncbi:ribosomal protection-like ABC-F family protein [Thermohalobacter berrensis]|uniref:ABC transporter ATP-binding protein n=1 Tax=Thermohalobacter berrensis TaxID=99594 RepID=A0A419SZ26_9FIRM|nr:ABC-F type ribosomal protection protein [Thermohalobacter berrensis]RKD30510.1 ABC transporter ATP-binding protein [Thermohalobacter berrensis]
MIELSLNEIKKYYGANLVLENITFEAKTGEKIGIIGGNGTGKTTIFRIIAGIEEYDGGVLAIRKGASIGYLNQIPNYPKDYKVIDVLKTAFKKVLSIREDMVKLEEKMSKANEDELNKIMKKYGELQNKFEHMGGYEIEEKLSKICSGFKFTDKFVKRRFMTLSGGEKTTVVLAKILLQNPDILLLDEPSNHLDIESVEWLEDYLKEYRGTVLIISHDRYFLDRVVNRIVEIEDKKSSIYDGNYSYYVEEKERRLLAQYQEYQNQQKKIKAMEEAINRFKQWGNVGDNDKMFIKARNMQRRIERMEKVDKPILEKKKIQLNFSVDSRSGKDVVKVEGLKKSFGNKVVLDNLNLHVRYSEKVAVLGKNGSGKSTLIKILLNQYKWDKGEVKLGSNVKIGYLPQNIAFEDENTTVLETFMRSCNVIEGVARGILAKFLFYDEDVFKKVANLSGGEKSRLKLCQLMHQDINLLILDEPTNHLDIDSREMLEEALENFKGTLIFISHDRYFINKLATRIVEIQNKRLKEYLGNYDYYKEKKSEEYFKEDKKPKEVKKNKKKKIKKKKVAKKDNSKLIKKLEREIEDTEDLIKQKDKEMEEFASDYEKLNELYKEKDKLQQKLDSLLEEWVSLQGN